MAWPFDDKPINLLVGTRVGNAMANPPEPEMRNASALDQAFMGFNALGAHFGYPDIAQRSADTLNLLSLPSLLSLMGPGAAALKASDAAAPVMARVYRGSPIGEAWAPEGALRNTTFWASDNPEVANTYAGTRGVGPNVMPADVSFKNPLVVDAGGREWTGIPWGSGTKATDTLADLARKFGHDGLVVRNVRDSVKGGPLATTYAALRPGTVKSALTGAPIYSLIAALAGQQLPGMLESDAANPKQK
jgi:hypothetical protein